MISSSTDTCREMSLEVTAESRVGPDLMTGWRMFLFYRLKFQSQVDGACVTSYFEVELVFSLIFILSSYALVMLT